MDYATSILNVSNSLKELFKDGGTLKGIADWDILIQCVVLLDKIAKEMTKEEVENG